MRRLMVIEVSFDQVLTPAAIEKWIRTQAEKTNGVVTVKSATLVSRDEEKTGMPAKGFLGYKTVKKISKK